MMSDSGTGKPKAAWREDRKLNASEQASRRTAQLNAHGRAILALAALVGQQSGSSGPDVLRRITDPETALTVLDSVGSGARELAETWQADAPLNPGPAQRTSSAWAGSPEHDPRVTELLLRGAPDAEVRAALRQVREEAAGKAIQKAARDREYYGRDMPAAVGVSTGPGGVPLQASTVHNDVRELGQA